MRYLIALTLYSLNILLIIVLLFYYYKKIEGLWPPHSLRNFILGWAWYILIYFIGVWLYIIEVQIKGFAGNIIQITLGICMIIAGSTIMIWAFTVFRSLRRVSGAKIDRLIIIGPYRYVRNPQYLGTILILLGLAVLHNSLLIFGFALLQSITYYLLALMEERELEKRFGDSYRRYMYMVPRFIPRLRKEVRRDD